MRSRRLVVGVALAWAMVLGACVAPARTFKPYEADAVTTAEQTQSAVETALLGATSGAKGKAYGNYLSALFGDTESAAAAVQSSFDSEQPPSGRADRLRNALDKLLQEASATLVALRIHARRGEIERLDQIAAPLHQVAKNLNDFVKAHER